MKRRSVDRSRQRDQQSVELRQQGLNGVSFLGQVKGPMGTVPGPASSHDTQP